MIRRRSFRRRGQGPRWLWYRVSGNLVTAGGTSQAQIELLNGGTISGLAGETALVEGTEVVIGGARIEVHCQFVSAGAGGNTAGNMMWMRYGLHLSEQTLPTAQPLRSPKWTASTDATADWMHVWSSQTLTAPANGGAALVFTDNDSTYQQRIVKSKRRMKSNESLWLAAAVDIFSGGILFDASFFSLRYYASILFKHVRIV